METVTIWSSLARPLARPLVQLMSFMFAHRHMDTHTEEDHDLEERRQMESIGRHGYTLSPKSLIDKTEVQLQEFLSLPRSQAMQWLYRPH